MLHWPCTVSVYYLSGFPLTEDTSKITVSSCSVKLQEVLSGMEKRLGHTHALQSVSPPENDRLAESSRPKYLKHSTVSKSA